MVKLNYVLIKENHISEIIYSISHRKSNQIIALCPGQKSKEFYSMLNANANYKNIVPVTFEQYKLKTFEKGSTVLITSAPSTFEILEEILNKVQTQSCPAVLALLQQNKKYLNIIAKKINNLEVSQLFYSANKFVGINDKIRDFVDKSYDLNRAAFYAYGEYINYFRSNLLKKIFRTEIINLDDLARSYGFTSAQRVKQGTFLKPTAQNSQRAAKKAQKRKRRREAKKLITQNQNIEEEQIQKSQQVIEQQKPKVAKRKKISKIKIAQNKNIVKSKTNKANKASKPVKKA